MRKSKACPNFIGNRLPKRKPNAYTNYADVTYALSSGLAEAIEHEANAKHFSARVLMPLIGQLHEYAKRPYRMDDGGCADG